MTQKIIDTVIETNTTSFNQHKMNLKKVQCNDIKSKSNKLRSESNISNLHLVTENGITCPIISFNNLKDKTLTIPASKIAIIDSLPSETPKAITVLDWLKNFGAYHPEFEDKKNEISTILFPDDENKNLDMSLGKKDEYVTIRFQSALVPIGKEDNYVNVVPTYYNTYSNDDPPNIIAVSDYRGVQCRIDGSGEKNVYNNIRVTPTKEGTKKQKAKTDSVLGGYNTGIDRNRIQFIQLPIKQNVKPVYRGKKIGQYSSPSHKNIFRDPSMTPTFTFVSYYIIKDVLTDKEVEDIVTDMNHFYNEIAGKWLESKNNGEANETFENKAEEKHVKIPEISEKTPSEIDFGFFDDDYPWGSLSGGPRRSGRCIIS